MGSFFPACVVCGFLFVFKTLLNYSEFFFFSLPVSKAFGKPLGQPAAAVVKHLVKKTLGLCSIAVVACSFLIRVLFSMWVFPEILELLHSGPLRPWDQKMEIFPQLMLIVSFIWPILHQNGIGSMHSSIHLTSLLCEGTAGYDAELKLLSCCYSWNTVKHLQTPLKLCPWLYKFQKVICSWNWAWQCFM